MNGLGMIGYKSSSSVWCAWHVQILLCQCSNFPGWWKSSFQPPAGKKMEIKPGLKPGDWTCPNCGANVYASKFLRKNGFSYLFSLFFFGGCGCNEFQFDMPIFGNLFFAYHGVSMATPKKKQHIISPYERYLKTTHNHQPDARMIQPPP